MKKNLVLLLVVHVVFSTGIAFSQQIKFNKVIDGAKNDQLFIYSIAQDQKGIIWFTSIPKGLQRYDGKKFTTFSHNTDNPNSLASNLATAVTVDLTDHIWVGTLGSGLDRFDPETKLFTHFRHDPKNPTSLGNDTIFAISRDRSNNIWIGTIRTLDQFNPTTGKFIHYKIDEIAKQRISSDFEPTYINAILEDKKGNLWIGLGTPSTGKKDGPGGLARLNKASGKFIHYKHDPANPNSLSDNNVSDIYEDSKNNLWVGTKGTGLQTLDRATGKFSHYDPAHPEKLSRPPYTGSASDVVTFITEDVKGRLWIGSQTGGINMYDRLQKKTTHYGTVSSDKTNRFTKDTLNGFKDSTAFRAFTSKDGLLWITANSSIYNVDFSRTTIPFVSLKAKASAFYHEEDKNVVWIQSDSALIRKNVLTNQQKLVKPDSRSAYGQAISNVMDMKGDAEGNIWMATHQNGLLKYNSKTEQFTSIRHDKNNPASLLDDATHALFFDRQQYLWIGTHTGLSRMDLKTGKCTHYLNNPKDSLSIGSGEINSFAQDKNGILWISSATDVFALDTKTGKFKRYKLLGFARIVNTVIDATGQIWAAGLGGLYFLDKQTNSFKTFTTQVFPEGVGSVWGMVEDSKGSLWLSTRQSIIKINKKRDAVIIFSAAQGVQPATDIWLRNIRTKDGRLFLGGDKGYYSFKPDELIDERTAPLLNFTNFKIGSQEIAVGERTVLTAPIWKTNTIELSYQQNTISFEFEAIDYRSQEEIKYQYKLENYDSEWRDIGTDHKATFFNLPHGKYTLHIKAINEYGAVAQKSMEITITPPWWQSWWAYVLYALLVIIAGYLIYNYQKYYIIKRERERSQQKELAQAKEIEKAYAELKSTQAQLIQSEKLASLGELTAGIAHEIQNPLNFVNNFSEVSTELVSELEDEQQKPERDPALEAEILGDLKQNLQKITLHGGRASAIVRGMLEHSRASTGQREPTDLNALADEYLRLAYHGMRGNNSSFNCELVTDFAPDLPPINVIAQDMGRVLLNLINNAFYAVGKKAITQPDGYQPTVTISTRQVANTIEIRVKDNGIGMPESVREKVFQPFFTTKPTGEGTGLGLSLAYDIVTKGHGGTLAVESVEGVGSEFILSLPFVKSAYPTTT